MIKLCKILSGPFSIVFAWWFLTVVVPSLNNEIQVAINDGAFGALLGCLGSYVILLCCVESWRQIDALFPNKEKMHNS
jgi:hypothetical protein